MSQYPLRLPDYIMEQANAAAAAEENVSINQMFLSLIAEGMGNRRALKRLQERAAGGDPKKGAGFDDRLPRLPPEPGDDMPNADR